jgi:hypothetical protein
MARQLLEREASGLEDAQAAGLALQQACTRVSENLRRSLGNDGFNAVMARARQRATSEPGQSTTARPLSDISVRLEGVRASVDEHGVPAVAAALESLLAALIEILSGLIGADMVLNILDHDDPPHHSRGGGPK